MYWLSGLGKTTVCLSCFGSAINLLPPFFLITGSLQCFYGKWNALCLEWDRNIYELRRNVTNDAITFIFLKKWTSKSTKMCAMWKSVFLQHRFPAFAFPCRSVDSCLGNKSFCMWENTSQDPKSHATSSVCPEEVLDLGLSNSKNPDASQAPLEGIGFHKQVVIQHRDLMFKQGGGEERQASHWACPNLSVY